MAFTRRQFIAGLSGASASSMLITRSGRTFAATTGAGEKTLTFAAAGTVTSSWDPTSHTVAPQIVAEGFYFSRLTDCPMTADNPTEVRPDLATSWSVVDEYTLEYKLRKGVTFHDGKKFSAEDVKATFEYACQPEHPASAWYPGQVEVEIVDDYTVRLHTKKFGYPALTFWYVVSFLPILSADDVANPSRLRKHPNGTGPFRYKETNGDQITFNAFDDYYGGRPAIDTLVWYYVPDSNTRVLGLLNGQFQLAERLEPKQYTTLKNKPEIATYRGLSSENKYMQFRCNKPPFDDPLVRMAAHHAIDRSQVLAMAAEAGEPASCPISPVKFGYLDVPNFPEYSPEKCQKLLADAGYPGGRGLPEIEYVTSVGFYPRTREYGQVITAMMQAQGFPVKLTTLEPAAWEQQLYRGANGQGPGHIQDVGWITGSPEPDLILRPNYYSEYALVNGVHDAEIDASLDKERGAGSLDERLKILQNETLPLIVSKGPSLTLFASVFLYAMSDQLRGVYFYPNGPIDLRKATLG